MKELMLVGILAVASCAAQPTMAQEHNPMCKSLEDFTVFIQRTEMIPIWKGLSDEDGYVINIWRKGPVWIMTATDPDKTQICWVDGGQMNEIMVGEV